MLEAIASADLVTWLSIVVKTLVYAMAFLAMGSVISILTLRRLPASEVQALARLSVVCAVGCALLSLARLPLRASFLMGSTWEGATDPMILALVWESPLGFSIALRPVGLGMICAILLSSRHGRWLSCVGITLVAMSFVFRGHALQEPRLLLAVLITLHILGLAFWIGVFTPLYRLSGARMDTVAGHIAHDFGRMALGVVGLLALAGGVTLWLLTGGVVLPLSTPYGQFFAIKLGVFLATIGLAAWNKLRLTPALLLQDRGAGANLRQSIRLEGVCVAVILLTTATLTTVSAPETTVKNRPVDGRALISETSKGGLS